MKVKGLKHGIYEIYWLLGGSSLAAVGYDRYGYNWMAPVNWISGVSTEWGEVIAIKMLIENDYSKKRKRIKSEFKKLAFTNDNFEIIED